jgi:hypothetical protein
MANDAKAPLSAPLPLSSLRTIICAAGIVAIVQEVKEWQKMLRHHHPRHCRLLLLLTIVHATAVAAVMQESKEWLTMPRHHHPHIRHHHCCTLSFTLFPLLPSRKKVRNSRQYRGTVLRSTTICLHCQSRCRYSSKHGMADKGAKAPLSALPPSSLCTVIALLPSMPSQEQARNGRQCQGTLNNAAATVVIEHHGTRCHEAQLQPSW